MANGLKSILLTWNRIRIQKYSAHIITRHCSTSTKSKWHLYSAVCLERAPILTTTLNDLEQRFAKLLAQLDFEKSLKSDFEMRNQEDIVKFAHWKKGQLDTEDMESTSTMLTAQDEEDAATEELKQFELASRVTEDDVKNNTKSLNRALEEYLVLTVKHRLGDGSHWLFPQGRWEEGETMRQAAERVLNSVSDELKVSWLGNAPIGFYSYYYPLSMRKDTNCVKGAKVFFFRAHYVSGQIGNSSSEYQWLTSKELNDILHPNYLKSVSQFLTGMQIRQPIIESEDSDSKFPVVENVEENRSKKAVRRQAT